MTAILLEDESLRDGLQFEKVTLPLEEKIVLFDMLLSAGVQRVQVGSFVNPKVVPQMADTDLFVRQVSDRPGVLLTGLVLNGKGLERALESGLQHISLSASASDAHSLKNVGKSSREALQSTSQLIRTACQAGVSVRAGVQCAFGCVYQGAVSPEEVVEALILLNDAGAGEFNLADTAGMAIPQQIKELVCKVRDALPDITLSLHLHDTRGLGIANMLAGYEAGVRIFDTSAGGLGGCPFVKGAAGNVATEDAVHLFEAMGLSTGIDLEGICAVTEQYERLLGRKLPGRMGRVLRVQSPCLV